jgi:hypothetical protein
VFLDKRAIAATHTDAQHSMDGGQQEFPVDGIVDQTGKFDCQIIFQDRLFPLV